MKGAVRAELKIALHHKCRIEISLISIGLHVQFTFPFYKPDATHKRSLGKIGDSELNLQIAYTLIIP